MGADAAFTSTAIELAVGWGLERPSFPEISEYR